jgi:hypothetical protein
LEASAAFLCDAAEVREGLLFVLGGGITRLWRGNWPAPLDVSVALMLELHHTEIGVPHELHVIVQDEDGNRLGEIQGGFQTNPGEPMTAAETLLVPMVIDMRGGTPLPQPGYYSIEVAVDGGHLKTIQFQARPREEQPGAPALPGEL